MNYSINVGYVSHRLNSSDIFPNNDNPVLALIDSNLTGVKYPASSEYYSTNERYVIGICHYWLGHWEDNNLNKVIIVGWIRISPRVIK